MNDEIESVRFADHINALRWDQGDHLFISGPTKCGKTTLMQRLAEKRSRKVSLIIKRRDDTLMEEYKGWRRYEQWPKKGPPAYDDKILLWPTPEKSLAATLAKQRFIFREALNQIDQDGNRAVIVDEGLYTCEPQFLNLGKEIAMLFYTGRSNGISMAMLSQRPSWVPKVIKSSSSHVWLARTRDKDDMKTLSQFGDVNAKQIEAAMMALRHRQDFVYLNPQGDNRSAIINTRR